ncbi:MAG: uroporphyrinogen-III synthase [Bacteroidales bacterium]|jgi:uroporphyrinogen-III synthase|nr:uroporphyrinogen-III synthase [Bacteroidales bacterium]
MKIKNILISQPKPEEGTSPYFKIAERYNLKVEFSPFIKNERIPFAEFRQSKVNIAAHSSFIFYSKVAIDNFFNTCTEAKIKVSDQWKYYCSSELIALYLQKHISYRKRKIFFSENGSTSGLINQIQLQFKKAKTEIPETMLLVLSEVHKSDIPKALEAANFPYTKAIMFRTVSADMSAINLENFDLLLFFSPAGVISLKENFKNFQQGETIIGTFGENSARKAVELGFRVDIKVPSQEYSSMPDALDSFLKVNSTETKNKIKGTKSL